MNENLKYLFARLTAPFHPSDLEWRAGATNSEKSKAQKNFALVPIGISR